MKWFILLLLSTSAFAECPQYAPCIEVILGNENVFSPRVISEEEVSATVPENLDIITYAKGFIGTPYVYGGNSSEGIDCSAFIKKVFAEFEIHLPRTSGEQFLHSDVDPVDLKDLKPNDLLFFKTEDNDQIDHVALYIGDGKMIHSSKMEQGVQITDFKFSKFWSSRFAGARRINKENL